MDKPKSQGSSKVRPRDLYSSSGDDVVNEDVVNEGDKGNREKGIESDHESDSDGDEEVFLAEDNSGKAETPLPPLPPKPTLPPQTLQPLPKTPETRRRSSSESDLNKSPATKANPNAPAATTPQPARKKREKEGFFSKINLFNKKDKSGSHTSIKASTESLSAQSGATASSTIPLTQKQEIARLKFFLDLFKEMKREQKNAEIKHQKTL